MNLLAPQQSRVASTGHSLIEMLVVVVAIGILSAISIPALNQHRGQMDTTKAKRNAQQLANIYASAQSAGHDFYSDGEDLETLVAKVAAGTTISSGAFAGSYFGCKLTADDISETLSFLQYDADQKMLIYLENGEAFSGTAG